MQLNQWAAQVCASRTSQAAACINKLLNDQQMVLGGLHLCSSQTWVLVSRPSENKKMITAVNIVTFIHCIGNEVITLLEGISSFMRSQYGKIHQGHSPNEKTGTCGNFSKVGGPPPPLPPVWECLVCERGGGASLMLLGSKMSELCFLVENERPSTKYK